MGAQADLSSLLFDAWQGDPVVCLVQLIFSFNVLLFFCFLFANLDVVL